MKLFTACLLLTFSTTLFAQSKKELQAEITRLKSENYQLKNPKDVELTDTLKKVSYGIGTLMAGQLKSQGGEDLNLEALTAGLKDVFQNKTVKLDQQEALAVVQSYMQQAMEKKAGKVKEEGKAF